MDAPTFQIQRADCTQGVAERVPANGFDALRILVIDDTIAIHNDFRKILTRVEAPALDQARAALFGEPATIAKQVSFLLDSATQGQEHGGFKLRG